METYSSFISQFKIYPTFASARKRGFEAHHIVPKAMQLEPDDRCVRLTAFQHIYAHYLLALEDEKAKQIFFAMVNFNFNKLADFEKVTLEQMKDWARLREEGWTSPMKGKHHREESKKKASESEKGKVIPLEVRQAISKTMKGHGNFIGKHHTEDNRKLFSQQKLGSNNPNYGKHWYNNGTIELCVGECPDGYIKGRLKRA